MTIDDLKKNPLWKMLTPAEAAFLEVYLPEGDVDKACTAAFNIEDIKAARTYARKVLTRPCVLSLVNIYNGENYDPDESELLIHLWDVVKKGKSDAARVSAANLIAEIKGWKKAQNKGAKKQTNDLSALLEQLEK
jgi:hypothetical protein